MVGRIARFQQLLHGPARLQKGDFIALDLDETLIMSRHSPSQLLTSRGVPAFRKYVHERFSDFKTKNDHCRKLQKALKDKVLVDQDCVRVIQTLQNMGVWVFGVTARYSEMAPATDACLRSLGLDLSVTAPFPKTALRDPDTDSYYADGVVYCNAMDKGSILDRFLENVVFRKVLADLEGPEGDVGDAESWRRARGLPGRLLFIDDRYENCQSVRHRLPTADRLSVQVEAYQFVPRWLSNTQAPNSLREAVLRVQMECFVDEGRILSDKEAAQTLTPPMHGTKIAVH